MRRHPDVPCGTFGSASVFPSLPWASARPSLPCCTLERVQEFDRWSSTFENIATLETQFVSSAKGSCPTPISPREAASNFFAIGRKHRRLSTRAPGTSPLRNIHQIKERRFWIVFAALPRHGSRYMEPLLADARSIAPA